MIGGQIVARRNYRCSNRFGEAGEEFVVRNVRKLAEDSTPNEVNNRGGDGRLGRI